MLGYCPECQSLRRIRPERQRFGERACIYRTIEHEVFQHECGNLVRVDEETERMICMVHGVVEEATVALVWCKGAKKDI